MVLSQEREAYVKRSEPKVCVEGGQGKQKPGNSRGWRHQRENTWADLQEGNCDFPFSMITNVVKLLKLP